MSINAILSEAITPDSLAAARGVDPPEQTEAEVVANDSPADKPDTDAETTDEPEKPAAQTQPGERKDAYQEFRALTESFDPTDPEQVEALKSSVAELQRQLGRRSTGIAKREHKIKQRTAEVNAQREALVAANQQLQSAAHRLRNGNAKEILAALGEITGKDPVKAYEEMSHAMAGLKKGDPEVAKLREELETIRREQTEREQRAQQEFSAAEERRAEARCLTIANDAAKFPILSGFAESEPGPVIAAFREVLVELTEAGTPPKSHEEIAAVLEARLAERIGAHTGRSPGATDEAKPEPRRPAQRKALSPSMANAPRTQRPQTHEERIAALARENFRII